MPRARNNPALSEQAKRALVYWPQISESVRLGQTTSQLWASIHSRAGELGRESPGVGIAGVQSLVGHAHRIELASQRLAAATGGRVVQSRMVALAPWSRTPGERRNERIYHARFLHTTVRDDKIETVWRTVKFAGKLPRSVNELRRQIEGSARLLALDYKAEHMSIDALQVLEV